jgi:putative ABC transport system substrate-binding protein
VNRREFLGSLTLGLLAAPLVAEAQQTARVPRMGVLGLRGLEEQNRTPMEAFSEALRSHGWIEGQNIIVERRSADRPENYATAAAELVALRPDVLVTGLGEPAVVALKSATSTIPIVMMVSADPVGAGLVASLSRPGGNVTGMSILAAEVGGKRLEILKQAVPRAARVAVLWNSAYPGKSSEFRDTQATAAALNLNLQSIEVKQSQEVVPALAMIHRDHPDTLVVFSDPLMMAYRHQIVEQALKLRLPMISELREFAQDGALLSYGANLNDLVRRAADYVDKILKGAKPGDLPIEQPTRFELVINLKTAKALGLTIPPSLLLRADEVIQ